MGRDKGMKIWAHRGCSQRYPENTLLAFGKAMEIQGLAGIELDIQMTKDGELVVIHDERVDRTTEGVGLVRDFTLKELQKLHIYAGEHETQRIPAMDEVFDLLHARLASGMKLNIELKNSVCPYDGMEEMVLGTRLFIPVFPRSRWSESRRWTRPRKRESWTGKCRTVCTN